MSVCAQAEPDVFEAVIVPHRSLGRSGLRWLAGSLVVLGAGISAGLYALGAWPVIGFTGAESGIALYLLQRHAKGVRHIETLILGGSGLRIVQADGRGRRAERLLPAAWLRAELEERMGRAPALMLRSRDDAVEVAASLGEEEKRALAAALREAIERQRRPVFDNAVLREGISPPSAPST